VFTVYSYNIEHLHNFIREKEKEIIEIKRLYIYERMRANRIMVNHLSLTKSILLIGLIPCFFLCGVLEKEDDYFVLSNALLDLVGTGRTEAEAKESFFREFDVAYTRYNELPNEKLSDRLLKIKDIINFIVIK
jgi:hypothetical protein